MTQVVITHTYSLKNRGDYLLLTGTINLLKHILRDKPKFYIFSADPVEDSTILQDDSVEFIHQIPYPVYNIRNLGRLLSSISSGVSEYFFSFLHIKSNSIIPLMIISKEHRHTIQKIIDADYVIGRSIDQLSDIFGFASLLRNLYVIWMVKMLGKSIFLHSQTIYISNKGLMGKIMGLILKKSLKNTYVSVREMFSLDYLQKNGVEASFIPAPTYYSIRNFSKYFQKASLPKYILIIPRAPGSDELEKKSALYSMLVNSIVSKYDVRVLLMGQADKKGSDDDYLLINMILQRTKAYADSISVQNIDNLDAKEFCERIFNSEVTISERFISTLLSFAMNIPTITIDPYAGKNLGIARTYDMQEYCLNKLATDEVLQILDIVISRRNYISEYLVSKNALFFDDCINKTSCWLLNNKVS